MRIPRQNLLSSTVAAEPGGSAIRAEELPLDVSASAAYLGQMHATTVSLDPARSSFTQEVLSHTQEHLEHRMPYLNIELAPDNLSTNDPYYLRGCYLRIKPKNTWFWRFLYGRSFHKTLKELGLSIAAKLNAVINSYENKYGLFWIGHDPGDQQSINIRFNATDNLDKIASNPDIGRLLDSSGVLT